MPEVPGRHRTWIVFFIGDSAIARYMIDDLQPGEDITDEPPSVEMTMAEWADRHAEFGLNVDGTPIEGA